MNTLLASASTLEGIQKLIGKFYYSKPENFGIVFFTEKVAHVVGKNGKIDGVIVVKRGNRYRFESIN